MIMAILLVLALLGIVPWFVTGLWLLVSFVARAAMNFDRGT